MEFVVVCGHAHAVFQQNGGTWELLFFLSVAFDEEVGSVVTEGRLAFFRDEPTIIVGVLDAAVVSTHCGQVDLDFGGATEFHGLPRGRCYDSELLILEIVIVLQIDVDGAGLCLRVL